MTTLTNAAATDRERWERERLFEALEAYRKGIADAPTVHKYFVSTASLPNEDRPLTFVASDETEDRLGDVVRAEFIQKFGGKFQPGRKGIATDHGGA